MRRSTIFCLSNISLWLPNIDTTSLRFLSWKGALNWELIIQLHFWFCKVMNIMLSLLLWCLHLRSYRRQYCWITIFLGVRNCTRNPVKLRDIQTRGVLLGVSSRHVPSRSDLKSKCWLSSLIHQYLLLIVAVRTWSYHLRAINRLKDQNKLYYMFSMRYCN